MTTTEYAKVMQNLKVEFLIEVKTLKKKIKELKFQQKKQKILIEAQQLIQTAAKAVQDKVHKQVSEMVTKCLKTVFEETYEFRFVFEKKRGRTEARPAFFKNNNEFDPMGSVGGGIIDITAFALRICKILLQRPPVQHILFLDEPFTRPSKIKGYREKVRQLLELICDELNFQIIMVTHDPDLACGQIVHL